MVVGAANESDWDIFQRMNQLYGEWNFKRVYYSPLPARAPHPLEEHPATPMVREHRLYQADWLSRVYKFTSDEMRLAYDESGFLPYDDDPKQSIASTTSTPTRSMSTPPPRTSSCACPASAPHPPTAS